MYEHPDSTQNVNLFFPFIAHFSDLRYAFVS